MVVFIIFDSDGDLFAIGKYPETFKSNYESGFKSPAHLLRVKGFKDIDSYADQHGFPRQDYGHAGLIVIDPFTTQQNRIQIYSDIDYGANMIKLMNDDYRKKGTIK